MKAQCLMETDKRVLCFSKSYQRIQIPLLMPCRYGTDTADIWERIYEEGETIQLRQHTVQGLALDYIKDILLVHTMIVFAAHGEHKF